MKALSVRQPWADQIWSGRKTIEFRSRPISYRGDLLICSSRSGDRYTVAFDGADYEMPAGVMLAIVRVVDCRPTTAADLKQPDAPGTAGWYSWVLDAADDLIVVPKPVVGRVNLFDVPDDQIELAPDGKIWCDYFQPIKPA